MKHLREDNSSRGSASVSFDRSDADRRGVTDSYAKASMGSEMPARRRSRISVRARAAALPSSDSFQRWLAAASSAFDAARSSRLD